MKRVLFVILAGLIMVFIGYIASFLLVCPTLNDIKAYSIKKEFSQMALPSETEIIETSSFTGNINGNYVEIWAGVLIRSTLEPEEIFEYFSNYELIWPVPTDENQYPEPRSYMTFPYLSRNGDRTGCYIIAGHYKPITQFDIRRIN